MLCSLSRRDIKGNVAGRRARWRHSRRGSFHNSHRAGSQCHLMLHETSKGCIHTYDTSTDGPLLLIEGWYFENTSPLNGFLWNCFCVAVLNLLFNTLKIFHDALLQHFLHQLFMLKTEKNSSSHCTKVINNHRQNRPINCVYAVSNLIFFTYRMFCKWFHACKCWCAVLSSCFLLISLDSHVITSNGPVARI